jgi:hypothetical protein
MQTFLNFRKLLEPKSTWVKLRSRGGLLQPSPQWMEQVVQIEPLFREFHGERKLRNDRKIFHLLAAFLKERGVKVDSIILLEYCKIRTFMRMAFLKAEIKKQKHKKRRGKVSAKGHAKLKKIIN